MGGGAHGPAQDSPTLTHRKQRLQQLFLLCAYVVLVAAVSDIRAFQDPTGRYDIDAEEFASTTIKADRPFEALDIGATEKKREEAAAAVPATYNVDSGRVRSQLMTLEQRIVTIEGRREEIMAALRDALLASDSGQNDEAVEARALRDLAAQWKEDPLFESFPEAPLLAVWLKPRPESVPKRLFEPGPPPPKKPRPNAPLAFPGSQPAEASPPPRAVVELAPPETDAFLFANIEPLKSLALSGLERILIEGVRRPGILPQGEDEAPAKMRIVRERVVGDLATGEEADFEDVQVPDAARANLNIYITKNALELEGKSTDTAISSWDLVATAAFEMAKSGITDTLFYQEVATEADRARARDVDPVMKTIKRNEVIKRDGDSWNEQSRSDARTYWDLRDNPNRSAGSLLNPILANVIFVGLLIATLLRAMPVFATRKIDKYRTLNVVLLLMCGTLVLGRVIIIFEPSGLMVPITASAILLAILTSPRIAAVASLLMAALLSIQYGHSWELLIVSGGMAFAGISSVYVVRKRGDITRAAIMATAVGFLAFLAITLATGSLLSEATLNVFIKIGLNGGVCLFIVPGLLSPLERLFGITTDIQLLEYSDLNNEILSRLAIEVPATYAHSLMLGQLAEAAAEAVGANGLLARVCAYYHDIGKTKRPEYFSENQTGHNIHDDLSPRLSSRAIASHVAEGSEIGQDYHLPKPIIDGILEHHGTLLISYFYRQALEQQKHGDVREEDFRYPGPKPRSRETAILMICDAVESGVRTIKNPNEERVREFVDRIIQSRSEDRQFDECEITLRELDIIGEVLTKRIMTSLHTRVSYPEKPADEKVDNVIPISGGWD